MGYLRDEVGDLKTRVSELNNWVHTAKGAVAVVTTLIIAILTSVVGYLLGRK